MSHHDIDARLREQMRELGALLGQTMVRQVGQSLLGLVKDVRDLVPTDPAAAARTLVDVDSVPLAIVFTPVPLATSRLDCAIPADSSGEFPCVLQLPGR